MKNIILFSKFIITGLSVSSLFFSITSRAQSVGIGTATPNANAVLELVVKNPGTNPQGLLLPKLTTGQRNVLGMALTSTDKGMVVFDVTDNKVYHWIGTSWASGGGLPAVGVTPGTYGASDSIPVFQVDAQGRVTTVNHVAIASTSDDLGNHIATKNIQTKGFYLSNDGDNEGLFIGTNGNIGIGTNNSPVKLNIGGLDGASLANSSGMLLIGDVSGGNMIFDNNDIQVRNAGSAATLNLNHYGGQIRLHGGQIASRQINFSSVGDVGIGVVAPQEKLDVLGTARLSKLRGSSKKIVIADQNGTLDSLTFSGNSTDVLLGNGTFGSIPSSADNLGNHKATKNIELGGFAISNDGVSGKGLSFDNNGNASIGGTVNSAYKLYVYGKLKSDGITEMSDRRLKKNIQTLDGSLSKVLKIRGVQYDWKQKNDAGVAFEKGLQIGLIAQEVEAVFPELVDQDDQGFKSVEYSKLVAVLIEAVKEQQDQIEGLKTNVAELNTLVERLELKSSSASVSITK